MALAQDSGSPLNYFVDYNIGGLGPSSGVLSTQGANRILVALVSYGGLPVDLGTVVNPVVSGAGLTWALWGSVRPGGTFQNRGGCFVYAALAPTQLTSQTITTDFGVYDGGSEGGTYTTVYVYSGHKDTSVLANNLGNTASSFDNGTNVANQIALSTAASSAAFCATSLANTNAGWGYATNNGNGVIVNDAGASAAFSLLNCRYTGTVGGSITLGSNKSSTTGNGAANIAVELLAAGGGIPLIGWHM